MCVTSLKPNLILMLTNVGNCFKTMKAIVFMSNFDAVSLGLEFTVCPNSAS